MSASSGATAGDVVLGHLRSQVDRLIDLDGAVRRDEPDAVHQMRTTTRRLRSALATYRRLFDRDVTDPIRDELKWLGGMLGQVRDPEVQRAGLVDAARALPAELSLGPVTERITTELGRQLREGTEELIATLDGPRFAALVASLQRLASDPPLRGRAHRRADRVIPGLVERSCDRVDRAARRAGRPVRSGAAGTTQDPAELEALHELRKAAKRARYAAESASDTLGRPAERIGTRMEALQDALGEHQDTVDARATLRRIGVAAHLAGENGFSFGILFGREERRSAAALASLPRLMRRATRRPPAATLT